MPERCQRGLQVHPSGRGAQGKKELKPLSAKAKAKVKPGKSAIVSLKPKKASRKKLAKAKKILVREMRTVAGEQLVRVRKLKVMQ